MTAPFVISAWIGGNGSIGAVDSEHRRYTFGRWDDPRARRHFEATVAPDRVLWPDPCSFIGSIPLPIVPAPTTPGPTLWDEADTLVADLRHAANEAAERDRDGARCFCAETLDELTDRLAALRDRLAKDET